jgi:nucleotide-binding universal stress UspA family protein
MSSGTVPLRRILVPIDFSDTSQHALEFALGVAEPFGARVTVMHAYDVLAYGFPEAPSIPTDQLQIESAAQRALGGVVARASRPGVKIDSLVRRGSAWTEIDEAAKETGADLIVMGTHGRRGLLRSVLGSVAEKVVRTAPCPVLTVHGPSIEH